MLFHYVNQQYFDCLISLRDFKKTLGNKNLELLIIHLFILKDYNFWEKHDSYNLIRKHRY
jgi:hypothetical protein